MPFMCSDDITEKEVIFIPKRALPNKAPILLRLDRDLAKELRAQAAAQRRTISTVAALALERYFEDLSNGDDHVQRTSLYRG